MKLGKNKTVKFRVLLDTKPLYKIIASNTKIDKRELYGAELLEYLRKMDLRLSSI